MSESMQCPQCGAVYPLQRHRAGRAVLCERCGHKFLAPPWPAPPAQAAGTASRPVPLGGATRSAPRDRWAEPVKPVPPFGAAAALPKPAPASPVPPVRHPGGAAVPPAFSTGPPTPAQPPVRLVAELASLVDEDPALTAPSRPVQQVPQSQTAAPLPRPKRIRRKRSPPRSNEQRAVTIGTMAGLFVGWVIVPLSSLLLLIAFVIWTRLDIPAEAFPTRAGRPTMSSRGIPAAKDERIGGIPGQHPPALSAQDVPPSGSLVTLWDFTGGEAGSTRFNVEYRFEGLQPRPGARYFWIVENGQDRFEFQFYPHDLPRRGKFTGVGTGRIVGLGPYTTYLEEQPMGGTGRTRISNSLVGRATIQ